MLKTHWAIDEQEWCSEESTHYVFAKSRNKHNIFENAFWWLVGILIVTKNFVKKSFKNCLFKCPYICLRNFSMVFRQFFRGFPIFLNIICKWFLLYILFPTRFKLTLSSLGKSRISMILENENHTDCNQRYADAQWKE